MTLRCNILWSAVGIAAAGTAGCYVAAVRDAPPLSFLIGAGDGPPPSPRVLAYQATVHRFEVLMSSAGICFLAFWIALSLLAWQCRQRPGRDPRGFPLV